MRPWVFFLPTPTLRFGLVNTQRMRFSRPAGFSYTGRSRTRGHYLMKVIRNVACQFASHLLSNLLGTPDSTHVTKHDDMIPILLHNVIHLFFRSKRVSAGVKWAALSPHSSQGPGFHPPAWPGPGPACFGVCQVLKCLCVWSCNNGHVTVRNEAKVQNLTIKSQ